MPFFVSRQSYWPDGRKVVEVAAGGRDYANPDMLVPRFPGEGQEYPDPRRAVEVAIEVCKAWREHDNDRGIKVACGSTHGFTMDFEGSTFTKARRWARMVYAKMDKCAKCGEIMGDAPGDRYKHDLVDEFIFCSENCAERDYADALAEDGAGEYENA